MGPHSGHDAEKILTGELGLDGGIGGRGTGSLDK